MGATGIGKVLHQALGTIQTQIQTASDMAESSTSAEELELLRQTIGDFVTIAAKVDPVAELKTIMNTLIPINRLPVEIFTYIILLTNTSMAGNSHPYLPYTWVCQHWRSVLIRTAAFWTLIQHHRKRPSVRSLYETFHSVVGPFDHELLRRSNSAKLDVILSMDSHSYIPMLQNLFVKENDRIRNLYVYNSEDLIRLVMSGERFPSLRGFAFSDKHGYQTRIAPRSFANGLIPVLASSDHLETFECTLWENTPMNLLADIFSRIRNLSITVPTSGVTQSVLKLLHNNANLKKLQIKKYFNSAFGKQAPDRVDLPELQYLSVADSSLIQHLRASKLTSLDVEWKINSVTPNCQILQEFNFPLIRYLYVRGPRSATEKGYCILGSKERIRCESFFSISTETLFEGALPHSYSSDCFHFTFTIEPANRYPRELQEITSLVVSRLTNIVELYLLGIPQTLADYRAIIAHVPSVEKVIIQRGNKLIDFIRLFNPPSVCPRLNHLSFTTFLLPKDLEKYANDVGRTLTACLRSRKKGSAQELKYIVLRNCPPLTDDWLAKLKELGTEVVTEKDATVNTYWSWDEVHIADRYLDQLEELINKNASHLERAEFLRREFIAEGLPSETQSYTFESPLGPSTGVNAYAIYSAPRTAGTEAMVVAASWTSINGNPNLRGIATLLSLSRYLKRYSLWSKDIVFVVSDGYLEGMQAWLSAYHGIQQSNLHAAPLTLHSGVIWTAFAIDYSGHSFSHLGIFYEGLNGRLPNQDLMNSVNVVATHTGHVPIILYDKPDEQLRESVKHTISGLTTSNDVVNYFVRAQHIESMRSPCLLSLPQALMDSMPSDGESVNERNFAVTSFPLNSIMESSLRTMNNLLERLHASFFFYLLTGPNSFLKIGEYLPSVILISTSMMFGGLRLWVDASWVLDTSSISEKDPQVPSKKFKTRRRSVLQPLAIIIATHIFGGLVFLLATSSWFINFQFV
ncbi:hypothetical protein Clacol_006907 [Clathrus columnatus]|uniref:F-box domain-containing protein n=1 Tax=Clathrus columnatus TaxID=1419009 RepID=A0AAV5AGN4_9AGAM|nr:hypothetical protein Clacol_006907 [Clathrus columnatus]